MAAGNNFRHRQETLPFVCNSGAAHCIKLAPTHRGRNSAPGANSGLPRRLSILPIDGPCMSASRRPTRCENDVASATATLTESSRVHAGERRGPCKHNLHTPDACSPYFSHQMQLRHGRRHGEHSMYTV
eukprot:130806-Chlamydomonas_euryale.AAC.9